MTPCPHCKMPINPAALLGSRLPQVHCYCMKAPIRWKIHRWATRVYDWQIPLVTQLADFIRDKTWVWEDHQY